MKVGLIGDMGVLFRDFVSERFVKQFFGVEIGTSFFQFHLFLTKLRPFFLSEYRYPGGSDRFALILFYPPHFMLFQLYVMNVAVRLGEGLQLRLAVVCNV